MTWQHVPHQHQGPHQHKGADDHIYSPKLHNGTFKSQGIATFLGAPYCPPDRNAIRAALKDVPGATLTGLGVISHDMQERIQSELPRLSIIAIVLVLGYLFAQLRNLRETLLALIYSEEAREQERRAAAIQAHAHAAQLRALRFQVNPHFLFNTLNSIAALIVDKHNGQAEQMVTRLAAFFRSNLSADPLEDVRLSEEMAAQRLYLDIEQVRFPDLSVEIDVPDELTGALVPSLILQPLIENAVKHGIATNANPAKIKLSASSDGDWLVLDISDDGLCASDKSRRGNGIGLANVHERLLRRFGDCCKFEAGRTMPRGFHVHMKMPLSFAP